MLFLKRRWGCRRNSFRLFGDIPGGKIHQLGTEELIQRISHESLEDDLLFAKLRESRLNGCSMLHVDKILLVDYFKFDSFQASQILFIRDILKSEEFKADNKKIKADNQNKKIFL